MFGSATGDEALQVIMPMWLFNLNLSRLIVLVLIILLNNLNSWRCKTLTNVTADLFKFTLIGEA